jgi:ATP-dependent helicase/nuclease subunit A
VIVESDGGVRIAVKDKESPGYAELWEREREELLQEHQRLLYVAMTRARDHLVMIGSLTDDDNAPVKQNTWLQFFRRAVPPAAAPGPPDASMRISAYPDWEVRNAAGELGGPTAQRADRRQPAAGIDPGKVLDNLAPVPFSEALRWKKATDLLTGEAERIPGRPASQMPATVSPHTRGSILHRCLEEYSRVGSANVGDLLKEFPDVQELEEGLRSRFQDETADVLAALTGNEELAWIFRPQSSAWSELPFLFRSGGDIVSGIIDRVVVREGKGYVIDYKAVAVADEASLQELMNHYRPQVRIYCQAARELFRLESVEGYLLFLDSGRLALTVKV